jgi:SNF2 family DNA or RNA helicase
MHRRVDVAHGDRKKRIKVIQSDADYVVINFDGVETVQEELRAGGFDLVVIDEANAVKTHTTKRWKAINSIITPDTWLWMATGTPASQSPTDAYGLAKMLRPSSVPPNFYSFRDSVMWKITQFKWVPKPSSDKVVNNVLQPAIRFTKEECLDLPELLYTTRDVPLTPQQLKYYKLMKDKFLMQASGETVTAVNAATNLNKLLQVSSGAVYTDDGNVLQFDVTHRYNVLLEAIEESTHKVLIFVPFRHAIDMLHDRLVKDKYTVDVIHGGISANQRTQIFNKFQTEAEPRILLIQPAAASHGVTLHAANTVIWWGPVTSNEIYHQANARVHRAGQKNPCLVVRLSGSSVEEKIYQALDKKTEDMESLLELYKSEIT